MTHESEPFKKNSLELQEKWNEREIVRLIMLAMGRGEVAIGNDILQFKTNLQNFPPRPGFE